ncbi:hypothetical protein BKA70DRAFT_1285855 [Coprinopsis sp. MPI-PUGE-AT-0042]|nr:hypothetical protein BKA70DRAFT_1285855 [Coprinopsis sp. MPI-PUGE-AT-0042]
MSHSFAFSFLMDWFAMLGVPRAGSAYIDYRGLWLPNAIENPTHPFPLHSLFKEHSCIPHSFHPFVLVIISF